MDEWVCRQNIEHFRDRLTRTRDETERATLSRLLAEQEGLLERLRSARTISAPSNGQGAGNPAPGNSPPGRPSRPTDAADG